MPLDLCSYLVMPLMGTDLGKLMKLERLSEDRVQFLVYQILKGLKVTREPDVASPDVSHSLKHECKESCVFSVSGAAVFSLSAVYPLGRDHPQGE